MPSNAASDRMPEISLDEFAKRRSRVLKGLKNRIGMIHAGPGDAHGAFRPHPHFEYLTGITDEPDAVLVLDPTAPAGRESILLLRPLDPEVEKWDGLREEIGTPLRERYGIRTVFRTGRLGIVLNDCLQRTRRLGCLQPFGRLDQAISSDLETFQRLADRYTDVVIEDCTGIISNLRAVKSKSEQAMVRKACEISKAAYFEMLRTVRPGMTEWDVMETLEHGYRSRGSRGPGYSTIVGAGLNGTVLHYTANRAPLRKGDLIVIDSGANFGGYTADVTRTVPASGRFSKRQREIYELVLRALQASIKTVRAGCTFAQIDKASRDLITKAGYGDRFFHGIGHHLGLEVHDITPPGPLKAGAIITIEPGIYLPDEDFGVRIEDDVIVTRDGCVNLTSGIPKSVSAIEKAMAAG